MQSTRYTVLIQLLLAGAVSQAQILQLPPRAENAPAGSAFAASVSSLPREAREEQVYLQIRSGNLPHFIRKLVAVTVHDTGHTLTYYVLPEYLAIGSDDDYLLMPMSPLLAQRIADTLDCILPTRKMVDDIYRNATVKLAPKPIPPSPAMITMPVFLRHNDSVWQQRAALLHRHGLGSLVAGDKKDVIISTSIYDRLKPTVSRPVVIYGWHQLDGIPIQPLYNGHEETYADYSHGIRLIQKTATLDGRPVALTELLKDSAHCALVSDEGVLALPRYGAAGR